MFPCYLNGVKESSGRLPREGDKALSTQGHACTLLPTVNTLLAISDAVAPSVLSHAYGHLVSDAIDDFR